MTGMRTSNMNDAKRPDQTEPVFDFGGNWQRFLKDVDDGRIAQAERSLRDMLGIADLAGQSFVDVGCGSGLFSLAARRLGAAVHSFDVDDGSVACANVLRRRYMPGDPQWRIEKGSILDRAYWGKIGQFDIAYSWGVLHHTGALWQALENVDRLVRPGGLLFIAIYNDQGAPTRRWAAIKRAYVTAPKPVRPIITIFAFLRLWGLTLLRDTLRGNPLRTWRSYSTNRGMSPWRDVIDWVGGYPFEASKPETIFDFFRDRGYTLRRLVTRCGTGCNEFVFVKDSPSAGC